MAKGALGRHSAVDMHMRRERARTVCSLEGVVENVDAVEVVAGEGRRADEREGGGEGGGCYRP